MPSLQASFSSRGRRGQVCNGHLELERLCVMICTRSDAHGDILRGLQVVEHAASAPSLLLGEKIEGK